MGAPGAISQPLRSNGEIEHSRSLEDFQRIFGVQEIDRFLKKKRRNAALQIAAPSADRRSNLKKLSGFSMGSVG